MRINNEIITRLVDAVENLAEVVENMANTAGELSPGNAAVNQNPPLTREAAAEEGYAYVPIAHLQRLAVDIAQVRAQRGKLRNAIEYQYSMRPEDPICGTLQGVWKGDLRRNYPDFGLSVLDKFADPNFYAR